MQTLMSCAKNEGHVQTMHIGVRRTQMLAPFLRCTERVYPSNHGQDVVLCYPAVTKSTAFLDLPWFYFFCRHRPRRSCTRLQLRRVGLRLALQLVLGAGAHPIIAGMGIDYSRPRP